MCMQIYAHLIQEPLCTRTSRLDLAKERYGGPFTTEQVEDVKSFWNILTILLALVGTIAIDTGNNIFMIWELTPPPSLSL